MKYHKYDHMYVYKGYYYVVDIEFLEDNRKYYHLCVPEGGEEGATMMPVSVYLHQPIQEEYFKMWIDMGMPSKDMMGGNSPKHYNEYYDKWVQTQLEQELELI